MILLIRLGMETLKGSGMSTNERWSLKSVKRAKGGVGVALLIALWAFSGAVLAQGAAADKSEFRITPYLWAAGFQGTLGVPNSAGSGFSGARIDATFSQLLDNLKVDGAGMISGEWRKGKWSVFGDWTHVRVKSNSAPPFGALYSGVGGEVTGDVGQVAVGYAMNDAADARVDLYGGVRYYDVDVKLDLQPGALAARSFSTSGTWTDGIIGVRFNGRLKSSNWYELLQADVGGGGSNISLQGIAALAYRFRWGDVVGGWRYLKVDYEKDTFKYDAALSGPFIGASFRF